ncbi:MAG: 4,5-DOPA dioxygenase extradiol [Burkholderiaceae bacterium]|nr:4,5-DOPA dioxygenase extradiol [Burkholderiaceae bacterium]
MTVQPASAAAFDRLKALKKSPRLPVLFVGHGSPMNAIGDNEYTRSWQALGAEFGARYPKPQLILCISAHWITRGWYLTGMDKPPTIHDFGGFPQELFDQQYPAPGAPAAAAEIGRDLRSPDANQPVGLDTHEWGFDHGTWSVLKPMFPQADIPVIQLSMDYHRPPAEHYALGRQLRALRERGVLIVGSGNIVHNLRATQRQAASNQAYDWAIEFDRLVAGQLQSGNLDALDGFQKSGELARLAHPTHDHYLPLLHAAGAADGKEPVRFFNGNFQAASISMRSVVWG